MRISDWSSDVCSSDLLQCRSQGTLIEQVDIVLGVASRIFADEAGEIGPFRWNALHGHRRLRPWRQWRASKSAALAERERAATREGRMERSRALAARQIGFKARSEEHTSELQSLMRNSYAVFCLKKKT